MLHRFYAPGAGESAEPIVTLPAEEAAHLIRVLRLKAGDRVRAFDGRGHEWDSEVAAVTKTTATVRLVRRVEPVPEPRVAIALAVAVLKGDKMDDVVRDAVMLGVSEIVPFVTERTEIGVGAIARSKRVDRWQRVAIASAKQCGRAVVPRIRAAMSFADWMAQPAGAAVIILVEPGAAVMTVPARRVMTPRQVVIAIGPEGGWTDAELDAAIRAGAAPVTLGTLTLRADAAPAVALAVFRTLWEDF